MTYEERDETLPKIARQVVRIMQKHPDEKGLIHRHSYAIKENLESLLRDFGVGERLRSHESEDRDAQLTSWKRTDDPDVFLSVKMEEALDLEGDLCRWQVICKGAVPEHPRLAGRPAPLRRPVGLVLPRRASHRDPGLRSRGQSARRLRLDVPRRLLAAGPVRARPCGHARLVPGPDRPAIRTRPARVLARGRAWRRERRGRGRRFESGTSGRSRSRSRSGSRAGSRSRSGASTRSSPMADVWDTE